MSTKFSRKQTGMLSCCVIMYTVLYFCRLNISAALDAITVDLNISITTAGLLQTVFAVVYACGQMVNGMIVDHVNPFRYMVTGLCGSALCNLAMSFTQSFAAMAIVWTVNAVFQSMLWTPIVRVVAFYFREDKERNTANAALSVTLIAGHFFAWAISGIMADSFGWRLSFRVPACIALAAAGGAAWFLTADMRERSWCSAAAKEKAAGHSSMAVLTSVSFLMVLATCILYGFIRDGVITWTPTILAHMGRESAVSPTAFTLILPLINALGVLIGNHLRGRGANPRLVVAMMMTAALCCCAVLLGVGGMLLVALLLGCVCAAMYGANTMLTGLIPMEYDRIGKSGMTAGMIDAFIYLGSALAGVLAGSVYENAGVSMLCIVWMAAAAASAVMMIASSRAARNNG